VTEVYKHQGIAHEITGSSERIPMYIQVRCGAQLPPQMGPGNIGDSSEPVTCLECLGAPVITGEGMVIDPEDDDDGDNDGDGWGSGGGGGLGG